MSDPWLSIPLADYEGHMGADNVQQLSALSGLFKRALDVCLPDSVAILGIAGGNGLEHANPATIKRIVGFFRLVQEELRPLPTGKALWLGVFASVANRS